MKERARWTIRLADRSGVAVVSAPHPSPRGSRRRCAGRGEASGQLRGSERDTGEDGSDEPVAGWARSGHLRSSDRRGGRRNPPPSPRAPPIGAALLIETALAGSAAQSTERRRAQGDAQRARLVLTSIANNVNQLAKWANANHVLPDTFGAAVDDAFRATAEVAETHRRLGSSFELEPR
jgi:hypothetical protein